MPGEFQAELVGQDSPAKVETPAPEPSQDKPAEVKTEPVKTEEKQVVEAPAPGADGKPADLAKPTEALYELPDGRKVDAVTLQKEWKENFLPDYTRKSQKIAEIEGKGGKPDINKKDNPDIPEWKKEDYVPKSYAEIVELAKKEALEEIERKNNEGREREAAIQTQVEGQLSEIRKTDPKLDENALFQHANKFGFNNLKSAYTNMKEMQKVALDTEQRVLKNIKTRDADPVAGGGKAPTAPGGEYDPIHNSQFSNAMEYLSKLKGKQP